MEAMLIVLSEPARRLTFAFAESNTKLTATLVVATLLQTRAPTGKRCGPAAGLLLSRPTMFHVTGVTVSVAKAGAAETIAASRASVKRRADESLRIGFWTSHTSGRFAGHG